jgi:hypothetical protein
MNRYWFDYHSTNTCQSEKYFFNCEFVKPNKNNTPKYLISWDADNLDQKKLNSTNIIKNIL